MTTNRDKLIERLQVLSGGAMVMSTAQLAKCLNLNPKVISRQRQENRFPIKELSIGSKIVYPLDTIADFFCSGETEPQHNTAKHTVKIEPERKRAKNSSAQIPDFSRKMLTRALVSNFEGQVQAIEEVINFFNKKLASDDLQESLKRHDDKHQDIQELKT